MKRKLLPLFLLSSSIAAAQQPNIVMLFVDDLGWSDLGYQNSEFETPNIDKLKHDGYTFRALMSLRQHRVQAVPRCLQVRKPCVVVLSVISMIILTERSFRPWQKIPVI